MDDMLGGTDPDSLLSSNDLARAYMEAGWLDEAIPLYERTLADSERTLGETLSTLELRNNLAHTYTQAGRLLQAAGVTLAGVTLTELGPGRDRHADRHRRARRNAAGHRQPRRRPGLRRHRRRAAVGRRPGDGPAGRARHRP